MTSHSWAAYAIALGLALRIGVACWNGLAGPSFGADADARHYQDYAVSVARGQVVELTVPRTFFFARMLGYVYRVTGESLLIGSLISCAAWLGAAIALLATLRVLGAGPPAQAAGMAIHSLLPSSIIWTGVTMREPYQLLCVTVMMLSAVKIAHGRREYWGLLLAALALGSQLHAALVVLGVLFMILAAGTEVWRLGWSFPMRFAALAAALSAVLALGATLFNAVSHYELSGGLSAIMARMTEGGLWYSTRTVYRTADAINPLIYGPWWLFQYLFEPLPWRATAWIDAVFIAENALRATLIVVMVKATLHARAGQRSDLLMIGVAYVAIESMWAIGTFNWGTAARHHVPAIGLLVAGALASFNGRLAREVTPSATS